MLSQFSSVTQSCATLCDPMNHSTLGLPVHHQFPAFTQTHVHRDAIQLSHPLLSVLFLPSFFISIRVSSHESVLHIRWPSIGVSASASVLPIHIQGWFPLGLTGLISLQHKGLSRVFSNTTVQKLQFFSAQPSLWSSFHIHIWLLEKPLTRWIFVSKGLSFLICCLGWS